MIAGLSRVASCLAIAMLACPGSNAAAAPAAGTSSRAANFGEHLAQCADKEGWSDPAPPTRIFGNVYDVRTCGTTVLLIAGGEGAILVDGATAEAALSIIANIERLGFRPSDVKVLPSGASDLYDRLAGCAPLTSKTACSSYATAGAAKLDQRLSTEAGMPDGS